MTSEQLKASILQMAIQGKLVEQRTEEGTAEELLSVINSKKEQLIKEKVLKKTKSLEPITEEELPFDLPQSWKWVKWGDIVNVVSARRVHQSDWQKEGIPFYRAREIAEMSRNDGKVDNELFISEELYNELSASSVPKPGDIMVTAVGTLGKTYIVKNGDKFYYKDASVICFENCFGLCSEYLAIMMDTPLMKQQIKSNSDGTTVATLTMVRMNEYLFPLPPLEEQHRIVAKIEELLPFVDRYAEAYEKLEQFNAKFPEDMKKSILQYAIQGKLVEQRTEEGTAEELYQQIQDEKQKLIKEGKIKKEKPLAEITEDEIPFDIPDSWKWVRVGEMGSWASGATPSRTNPKFYGGNIPWLKTGDLNDGYIDDVPEYITDSALAKTSVRLNPSGSVLMAMYGATIGKLGILNKPMTTNQACCACITFNGIFNRYLFYFLMSQRHTYLRMAEGGAQPNISKEKIVSSLMPLPPLDEQHRIVAKIEELLPYCDRLVK